MSYIAAAFQKEDFAGVGGPNIPFPSDGPIASCVASSPGGPTHVLLSDTEAEHIPGCNMAFRKSWLEAIGGFDPQFRVAGDDVDLCWRLRQGGGKLGFSPAAMVWHHYRGSVKAYWKQQKGYGKAEALLEKKWPEKYNPVGHLAWAGRIYGHGLLGFLEKRAGRIYQGTWGSAAYGRLYGGQANALLSLALMPEWYLLTVTLAALSATGYFWKPLFLLAVPLFATVALAPLVPVVRASSRARVAGDSRSRLARLGLQSLTAFLHVLQPLARLDGRIRHGLAPWRRRNKGELAFPSGRTLWLESKDWKDSLERLPTLESELRAGGAIVRRGGDFDSWDLEVIGGLFGGARVQMADEVDGKGQQLVRARARPRWAPLGLGLAWALLALSAAAAYDRAEVAALVLAMAAITLGALLFRDSAGAVAAAHGSLRRLGFKD
ncbi:MAG: hypothetical protein DMG21_18115 [Acidobacteria bacterium]|nr:MAG: hypothetical protein DMG21_18115 [Acidobacteriota bacterium]